MKKLYLLAVIIIAITQFLHAQVCTETFEDETNVSLNFTDKGQSLGRGVSTFTVNSCNEIDVQGLSAGTCLLRMPDNTVVKVRKL